MFGFFFVILGVVLMLAGRFPWLGKLPGDIVIRKGQLTLYIPIATSLVLSLILSLLLRIFRS